MKQLSDIMTRFFESHKGRTDGSAIDYSRYNGLQMVSSHGDPDYTAELLRLGAHPDVRELTDGATSLHLACYSGHAHVVGLLLAANASTNLHTVADGALARAVESEGRVSWRLGRIPCQPTVRVFTPSVCMHCVRTHCTSTVFTPLLPHARAFTAPYRCVARPYGGGGSAACGWG